MDISEIKVQLKLIAPILDQVTDPGVRAAINILLNIVEVLMDKCTQQAEIIQQLKDEINVSSPNSRGGSLIFRKYPKMDFVFSELNWPRMA